MGAFQQARAKSFISIIEQNDSITTLPVLSIAEAKVDHATRTSSKFKIVDYIIVGFNKFRDNNQNLKNGLNSKLLEFSKKFDCTYQDTKLPSLLLEPPKFRLDNSFDKNFRIDSFDIRSVHKFPINQFGNGQFQSGVKQIFQNFNSQLESKLFNLVKK